MKKCLKCKREYSDGEEKCVFCNLPLETMSEIKKRKWWKNLLILTKCKECGKELSRKATTCSRCGSGNLIKKPGEISTNQGFLIIIVALVLIFSFSSYMVRSNDKRVLGDVKSKQRTFAEKFSILDNERHTPEEFQSIINTLISYTDSSEKEVTASIYLALNKLEKEIPHISVYKVANGIKETTGLFRQEDMKKGLNGKQSLKNMTAFYITMEQMQGR
ncbi:hypothetical protein HQ584_02335 [Patescibacteria group bacterium]|nr:hypothetical protein [Patescibacteria group bacterium]